VDDPFRAALARMLCEATEALPRDAEHMAYLESLHPPPHEFEQAPGVPVAACGECGKWPLHHIHTGDAALCTCDSCLGWRRVQEEGRWEDGPSAGGPMAGAEIGVTKASAWLMVSTEMLMDAGALPDTRPRPPWRRRARWRIAAARERWARRAYRLIAGEWPHEPDVYE
jgi:hypothetical protein